MAATQRPVSARASTEPDGVPAWKTLPSWAMVSTGDRAALLTLSRGVPTPAAAAG